MPRAKIMPLKTSKSTHPIQSPWLVAFLLALVVAIVSSVLYGCSLHTLAEAQRSIQMGSAQIRTLTQQVANRNSVPATYVNPQQSESQSETKQDPFARLSEDEKRSVLGKLAFLSQQYQDIRPLSPSLMIAIIGTSDDPSRTWFGRASVWVLNLETSESRRVTQELDTMDGNGVWLHDWSGGVVIDHQTSPGEAVADIHSTFIDRTGKVLAETEYGTFSRDRKTLDARIDGKSFYLTYVQKNPCQQPEWKSDWTVPTTTITGLNVNDRLFLLPNQIAVQCDIGYADSVGDPVFPAPSFDGKNVTFHLPGYDVALSSGGTITYTQKTTYRIPCIYAGGGSAPLIREDKTGWHQVRRNVAIDPLLKEVIQGDECFELSRFDGDLARFVVRTVDSYPYDFQLSQATSVASFEYDPKRDVFQNVVRTPLMETVGESDKKEECATQWQTSLGRLKVSDAMEIVPFEACVQALGLPFKKFPIPGVAGAYFGFVGNGSSTEVGTEGPWCQVDGERQGCVLYRVEQGKLTVVTTIDDPSSPFPLVQPIRARDKQSMIIRRFPYEICWFSDYQVYDFVNNTSTASLVQLTANGSCSEEASIRLWPTKARSVNIVLHEVSRSEAFPRTDLVFNGKVFATIPARVTAGWQGGENRFPSEAELAAYAQQNDQTKFYFSLQGKRYVIDLAGSAPKLIVR